MKNLNGILAALLAAGGITFATAPVHAQAPADNAKIAQMQGADRQQRLVEGAKKEGTLTLYTSAPVDDVAVLTGAFEKKYGVKVKVWRAGSEKVLQRAISEARAGRFDVDIVDTNGPEMEVLHREKLLVKVNSPYLGDLIPAAITPHGEWIGSRINIFAAAYNTNAIKKEDVPKKYEDLLDPKWKGKLGIEAEDFDWFAGVLGDMGEAKGVKLFGDIVTKNGISVRKGHTLLTNLVASGEVPLALTIYNYKAEQLKRKGAPIDWFIFAPAIARPNGAGMMRHAPHPHAAVLYFDYTFSDAQAILLKRKFVPTSKKVKTILNQMPLKFIDPAVIIDQEAKWNKLYQETIIKRAK